MLTLRIALMTVVVAAVPIAEAYAQLLDKGMSARRPGSEGGGGRIGKVCDTDLLSKPDQVTCRKLMTDAKTPEQRAEVRKMIDARIEEAKKMVEDYEARRGRSPAGKPQ